MERKICIYAYDAFGMPFILTFNKAAGCPFSFCFFFQLECAGSLSCSDHVSTGEHWCVGSCDSGQGWVSRDRVGAQENRALLIGALCI